MLEPNLLIVNTGYIQKVGGPVGISSDDISRVLKAHMKREGIQQKGVAQDALIAEAYLSQLLGGKRKGTLETWLGIFEAVGLSLLDVAKALEGGGAGDRAVPEIPKPSKRDTRVLELVKTLPASKYTKFIHWLEVESALAAHRPSSSTRKTAAGGEPE